MNNVSLIPARKHNRVSKKLMQNNFPPSVVTDRQQNLLKTDVCFVIVIAPS